MERRINAFRFIMGIIVTTGTLLFFSPIIHSDAVTTGTYGENLTWELSDDGGELTISGSGDIPRVSWYKLFEFAKVRKLVIKEGITSIGDNAFGGDLDLNEVTIPNTVTSIGDGAFYQNASITSIIIPDSVTSIGEEAFAYCYDLDYLIMPDSVTSIGKGAFFCCRALETVVIPRYITEIPKDTFNNCSDLKTVVIPSSCTLIDNNAFFATGLKDVYYEGNEDQWSKVKLVNYPFSYLVDDEGKWSKDEVSIHYNDTTYYSDSYSEVNENSIEFYAKYGLSSRYVPVDYVDNSGSPMIIKGKKNCSWNYSNRKAYWYEGGAKQGTYYDPKGVIGDGINRGREICDRDSWYWLDSCYDGAKAIGKEVWIPYIYQDEDKWSEEEMRQIANESGQMADCVFDAMKNKKGKWVRYDSFGRMYKGWVNTENNLASLYPEMDGKVYYYDPRTGLMAKGDVMINGVMHHFDEQTGVLQ